MELVVQVAEIVINVMLVEIVLRRRQAVLVARVVAKYIFFKFKYKTLKKGTEKPIKNKGD